MPDWSIKIVPSPSGGGAAFQPDLEGAAPGDPLRTMQDDLVTWNNTTRQVHQPWPANADWALFPDDQVQRGTPNYLSDPVPPRESSRPSYDVAQPTPSKPASWTVYYVCKNHPSVESERGKIIGTAYPQE